MIINNAVSGQDDATQASVGAVDAGAPLPDEPSAAPHYPDDMRDYAPDYGIVANDAWMSQLIWKDDKRIKLDRSSLHNTMLYIENQFSGIFVLNEFSDEIFLVRCPPWEDEKKFYARPYQQCDIIQLSAALERCGLASDLSRTDNAIKVVARRHAIHPVRSRFEQMHRLKIWDGVPRLQSWLYDITESAQARDYLAKIGTSFIVASVARIYEPGTKFDHMLVFEGVGGKGKSEAFKILSRFGKDKIVQYFTDAIALDKVTHPASVAKMQGKLFCEFAELDGMNKSEDSTLKNFLTQTQDEVQKKYENPVTVYKRQCVFCGTTNDNEYLRDMTGNRRYWPVKIKEMHLDKLREIKDQLWAEAIHLYKNGYQFYITDKDPIYATFMNEQTMRLVTDPWEENIREECQYASFVYSDQMLAKVVPDISKRDGKALRRVTGILRKLGFDTGVDWVDGKPDRRWKRIKKSENVGLDAQPDIPFE